MFHRRLWLCLSLGAFLSLCACKSATEMNERGTKKPTQPGTNNDSDSKNTDDGSNSGSSGNGDGTTSGNNGSGTDNGGTTDNGGSTVPSDVLTPEPNTKIAFVGDVGLYQESEETMSLVKKEAPHLLLILGDYDYEDSPTKWESMLNKTLGSDFPVTGVIGNHDLPKWSTYQQQWQARLPKISGLNCTGDIGVKAVCKFRGLLFAMSGVGTKGSGHEAFLADTLKNEKAIWKICAWHKNQTKMQAGDKTDEVGWTAYENCREGGAFVATGHEHSYARTHLLSSFKNQTVASTASNLVIEPGKSFVFVSGLGGESIRDQVQTGAYFAKLYTSKQSAKSGALFCTFNIDGNPRKAKCEFKNVSGTVIDQFTLESKLHQS